MRPAQATRFSGAEVDAEEAGGVLRVGIEVGAGDRPARPRQAGDVVRRREVPVLHGGAPASPVTRGPAEVAEPAGVEVVVVEPAQGAPVELLGLLGLLEAARLEQRDAKAGGEPPRQRQPGRPGAADADVEIDCVEIPRGDCGKIYQQSVTIARNLTRGLLCGTRGEWQSPLDRVALRPAPPVRHARDPRAGEGSPRELGRHRPSPVKRRVSVRPRRRSRARRRAGAAAARRRGPRPAPAARPSSAASASGVRGSAPPSAAAIRRPLPARTPRPGAARAARAARGKAQSCRRARGRSRGRRGCASASPGWRWRRAPAAPPSRSRRRRARWRGAATRARSYWLRPTRISFSSTIAT